MPTTKEQEYEAAIERFLKGEDDAPAFVAALARLEMASREAEHAAYAAEATLYGSEQ